MMMPNEQSELLLDQTSLEPGLDVTQSFKSLGFSEAAVRTELKTLRRWNDQLREQAASLRSLNEELQAYAHTVAHALKNPLAVLVLIAGAIEQITDLTPQEIQEYTQQIKSTAFEMNDTIKDLLLLSEAGMLDRPAEGVDMASVVATARKRLSSMTEEYHGRISCPKTWPAASGYAPWIEEVWVNYISNALKYGGRNPRIELGASIQLDGMIRFWVRDHGPGIPPGKQARLFTPFTRLGQVRRPGNGLGLSIVRRIVEKLSGRAGVESEAGKGSLFFFTLPANPAKMVSIPERILASNQTSGRRMPGYPQAFNPCSLVSHMERSEKNGKETISREGYFVRDGGK